MTSTQQHCATARDCSCPNQPESQQDKHRQGGDSAHPMCDVDSHPARKIKNATFVVNPDFTSRAESIDKICSWPK
jgi:hypothetical protein